MTQATLDQIKNNVVLTFDKGKQKIKLCERKVGKIFDYNETQAKYKTLRLNVCNPNINELGLAVELINFCNDNKIELLAWQDPQDEYSWKYIRVRNVDSRSYPPVQGRETNDHRIPTNDFVRFRNQADDWMIRLHYRFKRNDKKAQVI